MFCKLFNKNKHLKFIKKLARLLLFIGLSARQ